MSNASKLAERWMRLVCAGTARHNQQHGRDQPTPKKPMRASCAGMADDIFVLRAVDMKPILLPDVLVGHHRSDLNP